MDLLREIGRFLLCAGVVLCIGCSEHIPTDPNEISHDPNLYNSAVRTINSADSALSIQLLSCDTLAAIDSIIRLLTTDSTVDWVEKSEQGICIQFKCGIRSAIIVRLERGNSIDTLPLIEQLPTKKMLSSVDQEGVMPLRKSILHFCPVYSDTHFTAGVVRCNNSLKSLSSIGYVSPTFCYDDQANLSVFDNLGAYGIIYLNSHGCVWPSSRDLKEVYMMTGERVPDIIKDGHEIDHYVDIFNGEIPLIKISQENFTFWVSPRFVAGHLTLRTDPILTFGMFCYSALGSWSSEMAPGNAMRCYVGFDWTIWDPNGVYWTQLLFQYLADINTSSKARTVFDWFNATPSIPKSYTLLGDSNDTNRTVHIQFFGNTSLSLWLKEKWQIQGVGLENIIASFNLTKFVDGTVVMDSIAGQSLDNPYGTSFGLTNTVVQGSSLSTTINGAIAGTNGYPTTFTITGSATTYLGTINGVFYIDFADDAHWNDNSNTFSGTRVAGGGITE